MSPGAFAVHQLAETNTIVACFLVCFFCQRRASASSSLSSFRLPASKSFSFYLGLCSFSLRAAWTAASASSGFFRPVLQVQDQVQDQRAGFAGLACLVYCSCCCRWCVTACNTALNSTSFSSPSQTQTSDTCTQM